MVEAATLRDGACNDHVHVFTRFQNMRKNNAWKVSAASQESLTLLCPVYHDQLQASFPHTSRG